MMLDGRCLLLTRWMLPLIAIASRWSLAHCPIPHYRHCAVGVFYGPTDRNCDYAVRVFVSVYVCSIVCLRTALASTAFLLCAPILLCQARSRVGLFLNLATSVDALNCLCLRLSLYPRRFVLIGSPA